MLVREAVEVAKAGLDVTGASSWSSTAPVRRTSLVFSLSLWRLWLMLLRFLSALYGFSQLDSDGKRGGDPSGRAPAAIPTQVTLCSSFGHALFSQLMVTVDCSWFFVVCFFNTN